MANTKRFLVVMAVLAASVFSWSIGAEASGRSKKNYLTDDYMEIINLDGVQVLDQDGGDSLGYSMRRVEEVDRDLVGDLEQDSGFKAISSVWELNQSSSFENVFVLVMKDLNSGMYQFVIAYLNSGGHSYFVVDYNILRAGTRELLVCQGETEDSGCYTVRGNSALFPY